MLNLTDINVTNVFQYFNLQPNLGFCYLIHYILNKYFSHANILVDRYQISLLQMITAMFQLSIPQTRSHLWNKRIRLSPIFFYLTKSSTTYDICGAESVEFYRAPTCYQLCYWTSLCSPVSSFLCIFFVVSICWNNLQMMSNIRRIISTKVDSKET